MRNRLSSAAAILSLALGLGMALSSSHAAAVDCKQNPGQKGCPCYCDPDPKKKGACPACLTQGNPSTDDESSHSNPSSAAAGVRAESLIGFTMRQARSAISAKGRAMA
jgi:hypothetical protein